MNREPANPENWEKQLLWDFFGHRPSGFFVEVGAFDPYYGSQTWLLEQKGWRGILVEPIPRLCEALRARRPNSRVFQAACGAPGHPPTLEFHEAEFAPHSTLKPERMDATTRYIAKHDVRVLTLDEILAEAGNPKVDFVSVDVEGLQYEVVSGFDLARHRPELVVVEDHLRSWATHRHMTRSGYRLVRRTDGNNWYVPADHPFRPSFGEACRLWRKVWPGAVARRVRFWIEHLFARR